MDRTLLLFVMGVVLAAAMLCGLVPALRATQSSLASALQQNTRSTAGPMRRSLGRSVAAIQMALSVVLIAGAFLFAFSLYRLTHFEAGVDRRDLIVADVEMREAGYKPDQVARVNMQILERLRGLHRVEAVSFSKDGLYTGRRSNLQVGADGFHAESGPARSAYYDEVGPHYFTTTHTRIVAGRDFDDRDCQTGANVAIVNQEFARHFFPSSNPIGQHMYMGDKIRLQVVGVVEGIRNNIRQAPRRSFYLQASPTSSTRSPRDS